MKRIRCMSLDAIIKKYNVKESVYKAWTEEELHLLNKEIKKYPKRFPNGLVRILANLFGRTERAITRKTEKIRHETPIKVNLNKKLWTEEELQILCEVVKRYPTVSCDLKKAIAKEFKRTYGSVYNMLSIVRKIQKVNK